VIVVDPEDSNVATLFRAQHGARRVVAVRKGKGWVHWKQHRDFEYVDRVELEVVPRWKSSHLSGDEWRVSSVVRLYCKGMLLYQRPYHRMEDAASHLPWLVKTVGEMGVHDEEMERHLSHIADRLSSGEICMQPGCANPSTVVYELQKEFSREGFEFQSPPDWGQHLLRAFCDDHATRGDCGLEDADANYTTIEGSPAEAKERVMAEKREDREDPYGDPSLLINILAE